MCVCAITLDEVLERATHLTYKHVHIQACNQLCLMSLDEHQTVTVWGGSALHSNEFIHSLHVTRMLL